MQNSLIQHTFKVVNSLKVRKSQENTLLAIKSHQHYSCSYSGWCLEPSEFSASDIATHETVSWKENSD